MKRPSEPFILAQPCKNLPAFSCRVLSKKVNVFYGDSGGSQENFGMILKRGLKRQQYKVIASGSRGMRNFSDMKRHKAANQNMTTEARSFGWHVRTGYKSLGLEQQKQDLRRRGTEEAEEFRA